MSTLVLYILLLLFILMPKQVRERLIIKFGRWSYLIDVLVYIILDLFILLATNQSYAVFALLIMMVAYAVDCTQIKHILAMTTDPVVPAKTTPAAKRVSKKTH